MHIYTHILDTVFTKLTETRNYPKMLYNVTKSKNDQKMCVYIYIYMSCMRICMYVSNYRRVYTHTSHGNVYMNILFVCTIYIYIYIYKLTSTNVIYL